MLQIQETFFFKFYASVLLVVLFTVIHYLLGEKHFNIPLTIVDSIYYTTTSFTAIGYGDIYPVSNTAKLLSCMLTVIFFSIILM